MRRMTAMLAAGAFLLGAGPTLADHGGEQHGTPGQATTPGPQTVTPCPGESSVARSPSESAGQPSTMGQVKVVPCPQEETAESRKDTPQSGAQQQPAEASQSGAQQPPQTK